MNMINPLSNEVLVMYTGAGPDVRSLVKPGQTANISNLYQGSSTPTATTANDGSNRRLLNTTNHFTTSLTQKSTATKTPCYPDFTSLSNHLDNDGYNSFYPEKIKMNAQGYVLPSGYTWSRAPKRFDISVAKGPNVALPADFMKHTGNIGTMDANDSKDTVVIHIGDPNGGDDAKLRSALDERNIQTTNIHSYLPGQMAQAEADVTRLKTANPNLNVVLITTATSEVRDSQPKDNNVRLSVKQQTGNTYTTVANGEGTEAEFRKLRQTCGTAKNVMTVIETCNAENLIDNTK